jgi:hypothetical protein
MCVRRDGFASRDHAHNGARARDERANICRSDRNTNALVDIAIRQITQGFLRAWYFRARDCARANDANARKHFRASTIEIRLAHRVENFCTECRSQRSQNRKSIKKSESAASDSRGP